MYCFYLFAAHYFDLYQQPAHLFYFPKLYLQYPYEEAHHITLKLSSSSQLVV